MNDRIIVGYDGSVAAAAAANWAAAEAVARQTHLCVLSCYAMPIGVGWVGGAAAALAYDPAEIERATLGSAESIAVELRRRHPQLSCEAQAVLGPPREVLIEASATAALMVVGRTGAGAVKAFIMGSVANAVVRRSSCPTVLVPTCSTSHVPTGTIVVGVDGSAASDAALEWAVGEASQRGGELVVVHVWSYSYAGQGFESSDVRDIVRAGAAATLDRSVETARARAGYAVRAQLIEGSASAALLEAAASADLLVVGSRGHGGLRSMLFGSVAHAVTDHARCPTVVIRQPPSANPANH